MEEAKRCTGWKQPMERIRWARRICFEDADPLALVSGRWRVADEAMEGEEDPDSTKILMIRL